MRDPPRAVRILSNIGWRGGDDRGQISVTARKRHVTGAGSRPDTIGIRDAPASRAPGQNL
jgi:hypothetical protein